MQSLIFWGNLLRSLRREYNLTQAEVAELLHTSRQNYSNIETGRTQPSAEQIAILSEIYEKDLIQYVINNMPVEYVEEQQEFKYNMTRYQEKRKRERQERRERDKIDGKRSRAKKEKGIPYMTDSSIDLSLLDK